jgi:hypothetical protein
MLPWPEVQRNTPIDLAGFAVGLVILMAIAKLC